MTLIELLVVITILGVLMALLLPVLGRVRAAARRTQCMSNMRQLALATHLYAGNWHGRVPGEAAITRLRGSGQNQGWWQWHTSLLPYVEREALYNSINWSFSSNYGLYRGDPSVPIAQDTWGGFGIVNYTAVRTSVDLFVCPADGRGRSNFAVSGGTWFDYDYARRGQGRHDGFSTQWAPYKTAPAGTSLDVPDGASQSVLFAEQVSWPSVSGLGPKPFQMLLTTGQELRTLSPARARELCLSMRDGKPFEARFAHDFGGYADPAQTLDAYPAVGLYWAPPSPNRNTFVNGLMPPNSTNCLGQHRGRTGNGRRKDGAYGLRCASSWHRGGVNLAFADGAVRFAPDSVDVDAYTALFSVDRAEVIAADDLGSF
jgi:prepilin-type processing-associated H-X9-DG protein